MLLAHKIRLFPTAEQETYFHKATGTARFAYNWGLAQVKKALDTKNKAPGWLTLKKQLNAIKRTEFPWMYEVTKCSPEAALSDLGTALANFWAGKRKGRKVGFPHFKKKGQAKDKFYVSNDQFALLGHVIRLPHIGAVAMSEPLRFTGKIMGAAVSRTAHHWFVSIQVEVEHTSVAHKSHVRAGGDLGLKTPITLSTGKTMDAPTPLKQSLKALARANRRLHRRQKGSKNRRKAAQEVARRHERIANIRKDWLHKATTLLARRYSLIAIEDLNVAGMLRSRRLARAVSDIGFGELRRQLAYKVPARGGLLVVVDRFYPSSRTCRKCKRVKDMPLSERIYVCDCGHVECRDLNAAKNLLCEATRTVGRTGTKACGPFTSTPKRRRFGASGRNEAGSPDSDTGHSNNSINLYPVC
ncbi:MAG: hypothetical protein DDT30_01531 [Dehalococcoidia bacterium]|nr:hypothetical protein [Bacillota bacterium]